MPTKGGPAVVDGWGVTKVYPENTPGPFPVHTQDKIVIQDIERWQDYVHAPSQTFPEEEWAMVSDMLKDVDRSKAIIAPMIAPGLFEMCHYLCSMDQALMYFITNPDEMHDLIRYLTDYELENAENICRYLKPEAIFHHDDWGSETNSFLSPDMFNEFFLEGYKQIYGYYHDHGVEFVIHHSDSYAANLVPSMIEMGINAWQGCMSTNNVPELIAKYGDKITFMGAIDNKFVDFDGWTDADCRKAAQNAIDACGMKAFVPCITEGGPGSVYPGTYMSITEAIRAINYERFGFTPEEQIAAAMPVVVMF